MACMPGMPILWRNTTGMEHIHGVGHALYGNKGTMLRPFQKVFRELSILACAMNNTPYLVGKAAPSVFKTAPFLYLY